VDTHWENNDDIDCIASEHHRATEKEVTKEYLEES